MIATKIVKIEGMHCEHCKNRVEAVVQMTKTLLADELRNAIEKAGYTVISIQ